MMGTVPPKLRIEFIRWAAEWTHGELGPELVNSNIQANELHKTFILRLDLTGVADIFMRQLDEWMMSSCRDLGRDLVDLNGWRLWFIDAHVRGGRCDLSFGVSKLPDKPRANEPIKPTFDRQWDVVIDKGLADPIQATLRAYDSCGSCGVLWLGGGEPLAHRAYVPTYCEGWEQCVEDDAA